MREPMILLVKPASLMVTHWKFMEAAFGSGVSMRRRAASYAGARTVRNIVVARRRQRNLTHSLPGVRLTARSSTLDPYGRVVATCSLGGIDLGEWLVRKGLALDWPQYSTGRYEGAQRDAERGSRGLWKGSYVEPWLYRACIRANGRPSDCSDDANAHP
jgi:endonuclease YncB( thermonuclease family)